MFPKAADHNRPLLSESQNPNAQLSTAQHSTTQHSTAHRVHGELDFGYGLLANGKFNSPAWRHLGYWSRSLAFVVCRISSCQDASIDVLGSKPNLGNFWVYWLCTQVNKGILTWTGTLYLLSPHPPVHPSRPPLTPFGSLPCQCAKL